MRRLDFYGEEKKKERDKGLQKWQTVKIHFY